MAMRISWFQRFRIDRAGAAAVVLAIAFPAMMLIVAVAIAAVWLWADGSQRAEEQYYALDGWYWIWLAAAYATAVIISLVYAVCAAWRRYG